MVQKPHLIKDEIRIICNTENFVPIVVLGLSSYSSGSSSTSRTPMKQESHSSSSSSTSPSSPTEGEISVREREDALNSDISPVVQCLSWLMIERRKPVENQANHIPETNQKETPIERGNLCDDPEIPEWLQEFRENLVDDEIPLQGGSHASSSHEASLEPTTKRREDLGKHICSYSFPWRPKLRDLQTDQNYKGPRAEDAMAKPYLEPQFWWLGNSRSQDPKRQLRVSKQSSIRSRGAGSSHSMDPGVSVQTQNFTRNPEKLAKVPGTREETKSHLHWQFLGIRKKLVKIFPGIIVTSYTTPIGD